MANEFYDLPITHGDFHSYVSLPEGIHTLGGEWREYHAVLVSDLYPPTHLQGSKVKTDPPENTLFLDENIPNNPIPPECFWKTNPFLGPPKWLDSRFN